MIKKSKGKILKINTSTNRINFKTFGLRNARELEMINTPALINSGGYILSAYVVALINDRYC